MRSFDLQRALSKTGLYRPAKLIYGATFGRRGRAHRVAVANFYSQFFRPGDLVFDIGANIGRYSEIFLMTGARVVAVEPISECAAEIKRRYPQAIVEASAIGAAPGSATFRIASESVLSSMSDEWLGIAAKSERFEGVEWQKEITVPVTTISELTKKYGQPSFIKIDVEGYEEHALSGMGEQPRFLSFEFNTEAADAAFRCVEHLSLSPLSTFNISKHDNHRLEFGEWMSREKLKSYLSEIKTQNTFGDIFVLRN